MGKITVHKLTLQFSRDKLTTGDDVDQALQAVNLINKLLQKELAGLEAQIATNSISNYDFKPNDEKATKETLSERLCSCFFDSDDDEYTFSDYIEDK
jgi:hypothetical protein